ncbi:hypothetical protein [Flavobacterium tegetincola]|uniref:hypothetical protein n=1 Tax=Flavobacterium tegetincola TaxID=150172 RepID=UPI000408F6E6|nr:hypothetical protein [Flavobacterium tegetincola]
MKTEQDNFGSEKSSNSEEWHRARDKRNDKIVKILNRVIIAFLLIALAVYWLKG